MILDQFGRPVPEAAVSFPGSGRFVIAEPDNDRAALENLSDLTPERVGQILRDANSGETSAQSELALTITEKNWDIGHALETRRNALLGCRWNVQPGDDTPEAAHVAEAFEKALANVDFEGLCGHLHNAILPGFAVAEIVWGDGGRLDGFQLIEQNCFTFRGSLEPLLVTRDNPCGVALTPGKFLVSYYRSHRADPARGGLIRPLAWLYVMQSLNLKDVLSYIERYGMPFVVAKVDQATYQDERQRLVRLIRNFGANGGGIISRSAELEMVTSSNTSGFVYFRMLEYLAAGAVKLILGQAASSGESSGLSKGDAQSQVRQDILEADGRRLDACLNEQLAIPWTRFNFGGTVAPPRIQHETGAPEDRQYEAQIVASLYAAGLQTDPGEVGEKFGYKLTRRPEPAAGMVPASGGFPFGAESEKPDPQNVQRAREWVAPVKELFREAVETGDEEALKAALAELSSPDLLDRFNTNAMADGIEEAEVLGLIRGAAEADKRLATRKRRR